MWDVILDALKAAWDWLLTAINGIASWAMGKFMALLPGTDSGQLADAKGTIAYAISAANGWVPIDLIIVLSGLYAAFIITFLGAKILLKLIP